MNDINEIKALIDSFIEYRNILIPLQESLKSISETYEGIRTDLDSLNKSMSGGVSGQLDKIHSSISAQARNGQELGKKIEEYALSGERYAQSVSEMTKRFAEVERRLQTVTEIEKTAEGMLRRLDEIINEKRASYNLKELQKSLDIYNKNVEKISEFINKDIASVLQQNAEKIETIQRENEQLSKIVREQGQSVSELTATFAETSALLRKTVEGGSVNEEYLFDAFDKWAADRKVKIKKK